MTMGRPRKKRKDLPPGLYWSERRGFYYYRVLRGETTYAGIGKVWVTSTPNGIAGLSEESFSLNKVVGGANLNLGATNFAFEADRTGKATSYGVKVGFRF